MHEMDWSLLFCVSSKLPAVFRSYGWLLNNNLLFFPEGCLCLAMQDQRSTKPATDTEPDPQCITSCLHLDSAESGCEWLQWAALKPASHPTSWLTTMLRMPKTQHLAEKLCKGAVLAFRSLNTYIKFSLEWALILLTTLQWSPCFCAWLIFSPDGRGLSSEGFEQEA